MKKQYHFDFLSVRDKDNPKRKDIGVLSLWHIIGIDGKIKPIGPRSSFMSI